MNTGSVLDQWFRARRKQRRDADGQPAAVRCGSVGRRIADEPGGDGSGQGVRHGQGGHGPDELLTRDDPVAGSTNGVNWNNVSGGNVSGATLATLSIQTDEHLGIGQ